MQNALVPMTASSATVTLQAFVKDPAGRANTAGVRVSVF